MSKFVGRKKRDKKARIVQCFREHVPIPPQQQLSYVEAYGLVQDYADYTQEFRNFTLNETKERMDFFMAKDAEIRGLQNENNMLNSQLAHFRHQQPPIGFSTYAQTITTDVEHHGSGIVINNAIKKL